MARDSLPTPIHRAAWIRGAVVSALLLLPMIVAWIFLGSVRVPSPVSVAAAHSAKPAATAAKTSEALGARSLAGKVVDETGAPLGGTAVMFLLEGETASGLKVATDDDGSFYLDGAPAKPGTLSARRDGYATASLTVAAGTKDVSGLVLTVRKSQGVQGTVVDGEGKPVDHALIKCEGDKSNIVASTGADGKFTLPTDPEGCTATASHPDYGVSEPQALRPGARNVLELPSAGGIAGVVVDEQGKPVTQYMIGVESFIPADKGSEGLGGMSQNVNDPAGSFTLANLARGKYVLTATTSGRPPARSDSIEVTSGRVTRGVRITLAKGLTLSGTVTDRSTKKPIAGARIVLDNATSAGSSGVQPATSDESGNFTLEGAPTGSFSIRVQHNEYRERIVTLDGRGRPTLRADIDLQPGGGDTATELTGIGATLGQGAGFVFISSLISGGPAEKAGVQQGDRIVRIDGQSAESFSISDCITRLRGPEGTVVVMTVGRGSAQTDISITRAVIVH